MKLTDGFIGNIAGSDLNSLGHRCSEIESINFHNYFLIVGDHINLAFNQSVESTYPYLLSRKCRMSFYNLSVFNGGMDVAKNNLLLWLSKYNKPKFLIVGFEFLNSLCHLEEREKLSNSNFANDDINQLYEHGNHSGYLHAKKLLTSKMFMTYCSMPIYQITFSDNIKLFDKDIFTVNLLNKDDQNEITNSIHNLYNQNNLIAKP
jgi:hypothetical protein